MREQFTGHRNYSDDANIDLKTSEHRKSGVAQQRHKPRKPYCSRFDNFWAAINWSLPDGMLASIWNVDRGNLRSRRKRLKQNAPRWKLPDDRTDHVLIAAASVERLKAKCFEHPKPRAPRAFPRKTNRFPTGPASAKSEFAAPVIDDLLASHPIIANTTLARLETFAELLTAEEPENDLHHWINLSAVLVERAKQIRQRIEQLAIAWIEANGPTEIGDVRYTVGYPKVVRCIDSTRCMDLLLTACGGDLDAVVGHLRTDPFKYGSVRSVLDETAFQQCFQTDVKAKLVEGQARPQLLAVNTRFAVSPPSGHAAASNGRDE